MATTSIWRVHSELSQILDYATNPDKTANPEYEKSETDDGEKWLDTVISYAMRPQATQKTVVNDECAEIARRYISGVNCQPETAHIEMQAIKRKFGKTDGVIAYHGYQSFAEGEVTPEIAHEIGVKLAEKLWGERYQVVVTTHLDKAHHLHNHFVVNTVSHIDGIKFRRTKKDYYTMQKESDALCNEYKLSVIDNPKRGKGKHYAEWDAERNNKPTYRGLVKADIDRAIAESMIERQFWDALKRMGYSVKYGQDITVCPEGKERGLKLCRNFGEDYSIESIRKRILQNTRPQRRVIWDDPPPKRVRIQGSFQKARKLTGLRALYFSYLYKMGVLPKRKEPSSKRVYFLYREDIRFIRNISKETRLLVRHGIDTVEQLTTYKDGLTAEIAALSGERKRLRYQVRGVQGDEKMVAMKTGIAALSVKIGELRKEVRLCEDIERRSAQMETKIHTADEEQNQKSIRKEKERHESFRGRG
jgi:hypothetical protein